MCLEEKRLVDAHIVPASFYRYMKNDSGPFEIRSNVKGEHKRRSHTGIYDNTILCEDCEKLFGRCDDYAQAILLPDAKKEDLILNPDGVAVGYKLENVNYRDLKLFFLSVLWRASVSTRREFSKINVGPFEQTLRKMIQEGDPGDYNAFSVAVTRFNDYLGKRFLFDPHKNRIDGINIYRFYLGAGYKIFIKVDKRPLAGILVAFVLKPNQPLHVAFTKDLIKSKEFNVFRDIYRKQTTLE